MNKSQLYLTLGLASYATVTNIYFDKLWKEKYRVWPKQRSDLTYSLLVSYYQLLPAFIPYAGIAYMPLYVGFKTCEFIQRIKHY
jgi:hypothetical protein